MKLYNISSEHVTTHRAGWNNIIDQLINSAQSDIGLVDFVDKYFNPWMNLSKNMICNDITYNFKNKDAYYHRLDSFKHDISIYYDKYNIFHAIKWYPENNEFIFFDGCLYSDLIEKYNIEK